VLGIIGRNGAGKSTLLKILSRVAAPTTGNIRIAGRVASLLEVGTGMHPELTGRENIFLNGAILGMRKKEIQRKLDEIVDFSGVERYIDTPVKRYSSGMHVRLGFAVAAHLEPDILIVDEVLAVGDAEFQKKCMGKMQDVSRGEGRTILFVSHNLAAVGELCTTGMVLQHGKVTYTGTSGDAIQQYLACQNAGTLQLGNLSTIRREGNQRVVFEGFATVNTLGQETDCVLTGDTAIFQFNLRVNDPAVRNVDIGFSLHDKFDKTITYLYSGYQQVYFTPGQTGPFTVTCRLENFPFTEPLIKVRGRMMADGEEADWPDAVLGTLQVQEGNFYGSGQKPSNNAPVLIKGIWG
jgi:lipopolysaccharide transport system ATP-binding protein